MTDRDKARKRKPGKRGAGRVEGGCLCGLVRYRVKGKPLSIVNCHCVLCRRVSGAPFVTWLTLNAKDLTFTKMLPVRFPSSSKADRSFCEQCGTPITFQYRARRKFIDVTVGSLDAPERFVPTMNIYMRSHIRWVPLDKSLAQHDGAPEGD